MDNQVFDFWNKLMLNMWSRSPAAAGTPFAWFKPPDKSGNPWQIPLKMTQAMSESLAAFAGDKRRSSADADSLSDVVSGLMHTGFDAYLEMQRMWFNATREGVFPAQDFEAISQTPLAWLGSIKKVLGMLPNVQTPGGSASSQEMIARYTAFTAKMSELLYHLYLPMDNASKAILKNIEGLTREKKLPQNLYEPSALWLSVLESSYLDLLKSPKYTKLLHETADAYEEYCQARRVLYKPPAGPGVKSDGRGVDGLSDEIGKLREKLEELLKKVDSQTVPASKYRPD